MKMKLKFDNVQGLEEGIYAVQDILKFEVSDNADIIVTAVRAEEEETLFVSLKEGKGLIKILKLMKREISRQMQLCLICQEILYFM